ncbi:MAG: DUF5724 domain-containing protein [Verrucomicrobiota bacterium]
MVNNPAFKKGSEPIPDDNVANGMGLFRDDQRTWPEPPCSVKVDFVTPATLRLIEALDAFLYHQRERIIQFVDRYSQEISEQALGEVRHFPEPNFHFGHQEDLRHLPLPEVWETWWKSRDQKMRDPDGYEALRAWMYCNWNLKRRQWKSEPPALAALDSVFGGKPNLKLHYPETVEALFGWVLRLTGLDALRPDAGGRLPVGDFLLDAMEKSFALVPDKVLRQPKLENSDAWHWRDLRTSAFSAWHELSTHLKPAWTPAQIARLWRLLRWKDEPLANRRSSVSAKLGLLERWLPRKEQSPVPSGVAPLSERCRPPIKLAAAAHAVGAATDADILELLLGPHDGYFHELSEATDPHKRLVDNFPQIRPLVQRCVARILEVELARGPEPTPVSEAMRSIERAWGTDALQASLVKLGKAKFVRGYIYEAGVGDVFSHFIRVCHPCPEDTAAEFKAKTTAARIPESRLVELAVYARQWAPFVDHALGWPSFEDGVCWLHAHTRGANLHARKEGGNDETTEQIECWEPIFADRTPLQADDLEDGAVDVAWFQRVHSALGPERWETLQEAAKLTGDGAGHVRAQLFACALLDQIPREDLLKRVRQKRHQDSVRALGLLPLAAGAKRDEDIQERYRTLLTFQRESREFGPDRRASEKRAVEIALQNLARTAGYADPIRLEWAMETSAVADLAEGPLRVAQEGITAELGLDPWGEVEFTVLRDGKALADIPAKFKKLPPFAALRERRTELKRQAARVRRALEQMMIRGDQITAQELPELLKHPLLSPMLHGLVLAGDGVLGYPVQEGKALEDATGKVEPLAQTDALRIAHPVDLLPAKAWAAWQKDCFARERIQPFKQVFRELYLPVADELNEATASHRYAGIEVKDKQAFALLSSRNWVSSGEEPTRRVFHEAGITAWLNFKEAFHYVGELEEITIDTVNFTPRGKSAPVKLADVPPRLFSEVMRDLDLVTAVARTSAGEPAASASMVAQRAVLVLETCTRLKLSNVRVIGPQVEIAGQLGNYLVHLGTGVARKADGKELILQALPAAKPRVFLPFAEDDAQTTEVLSKILLLARDNAIKDPSILSQLQ